MSLLHLEKNTDYSLSLVDFEKIIHLRLEKIFNQYLREQTYPAPLLQDAMAYSVMNGGKRLRPLFVYATGRSFGATWENCDAAAIAIELIHAYSLIHDDLPAMDNADTRRGQATCHKKYSEGLAILTGDALQTLAFEILASHPSELNTQQRIAMIEVLTSASGPQGMAGGQALDIQGVHSLSDIEIMYALKTGALFNAALQLGAIAADIKDPKIFKQLKLFSQNLGLAFQIQDDLLDLNDSHTTGKPQGLDASHNKFTYARSLGSAKAKTQISNLFQEALGALALIEDKTSLLKELAHQMMGRKN